MRLNKNTKIVGKNVVLVPYREKHVSKYHDWMKSEELQELTASEPLSLEEEYQMQKSWLEDNEKCTFIILEKETYEKTKNEIESMIGDTNIFKKHHADYPVAEIEIMIAEKKYRGKRYGWESVILMILYGIIEIKLQYFQAKISLKNEISCAMFKKLGFVEKSRSEVFAEITLEKTVTDEWTKWLQSECKFEIAEHD